MTPRKELFIKIQEAIATIPEIEYVDLHRKQFDNEKENYPNQYTSALIRIGAIDYESLVEHIKQGEAEIEITLYCQDGWLDQHQTTADPNNGLIEIDLFDKIIEVLEFMKGDSFEPLELIQEDENDVSENNLMSYRIKYRTHVYRRVNYPVQNLKKLTLKPHVDGILD